jgi:hypothetical protein
MLHLVVTALMIEAVSSSEMLINIYQTSSHNISELPFLGQI